MRTTTMMDKPATLQKHPASLPPTAEACQHLSTLRSMLGYTLRLRCVFCSRTFGTYYRRGLLWTNIIDEIQSRLLTSYFLANFYQHIYAIVHFNFCNSKYPDSKDNIKWWNTLLHINTNRKCRNMIFSKLWHSPKSLHAVSLYRKIGIKSTNTK